MKYFTLLVCFAAASVASCETDTIQEAPVKKLAKAPAGKKSQIIPKIFHGKWVKAHPDAPYVETELSMSQRSVNSDIYQGQVIEIVVISQSKIWITRKGRGNDILQQIWELYKDADGELLTFSYLTPDGQIINEADNKEHWKRAK